MPEYSYSRVGTYEQCPLKYRFRYIDRIKKAEEGVEAFLGGQVHAALQEAFRLEKEFGREPDVESAKQYFLEGWERDMHPDVIVRDAHAELEDYRRKGLRLIENFFEMEEGRDYGELVGLEYDLHFSLGGKSVRGFIDRLHRDGSTFHVIDYKTSKKDMTQEEADVDTQLALYELGLRELFPDVEHVVLHWYMLGHKNIVDSTRESGELDRLSSEFATLIDAIESAVEFRPEEDRLCGWCEYKDECEAEKASRRLRAAEVEPSAVDMVEEYAVLDKRRVELKADLKEIESAMGDLKVPLVDLAASTGTWSIEGSEHALDIKRKAELKLPGKGSNDRSRLDEVLGASTHWEEVSSVDKKMLLEALKAGVFGPSTGEVRELLSEEETFTIKPRLL